MTDNPSDEDWPTNERRPDAMSAGPASLVQWQISVRDYAVADPVSYIMETYGDTREQAEAIVKNCRAIEE
jgi:hypothetical protein